MSYCLFCGAPLSVLDCPYRIEAFKLKKGRAEDEPTSPD
jgi:hypothetical protein